MKTIFTKGFIYFAFCFLLSAFCFLPSAFAQRFIGGITAGLNMTQVDGDEVFGYHKAGFHGGPFVKLMLDKKQRFSLTMELLYNQKGAHKKYPVVNEILCSIEDTVLFDPFYPDHDNKTFYHLRTDYLEIPLAVHFEDPRSRIGIGVGFAWSRLAYIKESVWNFNLPNTASGARRLTTTTNSGRYFRNDWSVLVDVNIPIYKGLKFTFRFQYSLAPFGIERNFYSRIDDKAEPVSRKPYHNTLTFRLVYSFNEKYIENNNYDDNWKRIGPRWIRDPEAMRW